MLGKYTNIQGIGTFSFNSQQDSRLSVLIAKRNVVQQSYSSLSNYASRRSLGRNDMETFHRHSLAVSFSISSWSGANSLRSMRLNSCNKKQSHSNAEEFNTCFKYLPHYKYEAYSESKYRFAVKKKNRVRFRTKFYCYQIPHSSNYFFNIFAAIIEALIVAGHKFLCTLLIKGGPPATTDYVIE
jgi:hypothetical protein